MSSRCARRLLLMFCVAALPALGVASCSSSGVEPRGGSGGAGGSSMPAGSGGTATTGSGGAGSGGSSGSGGTTGGSGGTASPPDAASDAPAGDTTAPAGGCAGAPVCEDFEAYAAGSQPGGIWQPQVQNGTLVVDEMKAHSGKRALHLKGGRIASTTLYISTQMSLPAASNVFYGRAMVFLPVVPNGDGLHWDMIRGSGKLPGGGSAQYNIATARGNFLTDSEPNDCTRYSKTPFPSGRWACLSWQFDGSPAATGAGTKNEIHLWLDGKPVDDATVVRFGDQCTYGGRPEWVAPKFDTFKIGWQQYHPGPEFEMFIDDIAIGEQMIPCPTP